MYGLLLRLSGLDADAAGAVRVIGFFDALMEQGATVEVVLQRTAALAGCAVGVRTADGRLSERADVDGGVCFGEPPASARCRRLSSGDEVWIERDGPSLPLDDLLVERFAIACTVALGWRRHGVEDLDQAALLRLAVDPAEDEAERRRALGRLGIDPTAVVYAAAVAAASDRVDRTARELAHSAVAAGGAGAPAYTAPVRGIHLLVGQRPLPTEHLAVPVGSRVGLAEPHTAAQLPAAWREARIALRYAMPSRHEHPPYAPEEAVLVRYRQLGGFGAVAERLPPDAISDIEDVQALDKLATDSGGSDLLHTLEIVAATGSLRHAATMLHMHHNSVAHRVGKAEKVLGFSIAQPYSRSRLMLALVLRRLRESADLF